MPPRLLFVALTNDVGTDRIVMEAGRHGARCAVLAPAGAFAALPRCVAERFETATRLGSFGIQVQFRRALAAAVKASTPDWVVPLDDLSATLLRSLGRDAAAPPGVRSLVARSLGSPAGYDACCQRVALMNVAAQVGVRVPPFASASIPGAVSNLPLPVMVKRDQSSGSGGVVRIDTGRQRAAALRNARLKTTAKVLAARLAGFRHQVTPALVQGVVEGRLAMYTAACRDGVLVDGVGFEAVEVHPTKRASTVLRRISHPEMQASARMLVAALGCSGFVSFDFIVDGAGSAFLIEMNPRPIGSTHLGRLFGHDLVAAFLNGKPLASAAAIAVDTPIALFPKELERDPGSTYLSGPHPAVLDLPENEPAVVAAYLAHLKRLHPERIGDLDNQFRAMQVRTRRPGIRPMPGLGDLPLAS